MDRREMLARRGAPLSALHSCRTCAYCFAGQEQYCAEGNVQAYGSVDRDGTITQGGYSTHVVVVEDCCAAATMDLHRHELEVINMIYCHVATLDEVVGFFA